MPLHEILEASYRPLLSGLKVTLQLNGIVWLCGILLGCIFGAAAAKWKGTAGSILKLSALVFIGTPFLVLLFWMHYPLQALLGVVIEPFVTAAFTLSLVNVLLVADLVRGGIEDFPRQYLDVAKIAGLRRRTVIWQIQLPLLLRDLLPKVLLVQIVMLHASLFASLISVDELFRAAQRVNSRLYRPVEIYTLLAAFFLAATLPLYGLASYLRRRFTRDISER